MRQRNSGSWSPRQQGGVATPSPDRAEPAPRPAAYFRAAAVVMPTSTGSAPSLTSACQRPHTSSSSAVRCSALDLGDRLDERGAVDVLPEEIGRQRQAQGLGFGVHLHFAEAGVAHHVRDGVGVVQAEDDVGEGGGLGATWRARAPALCLTHPSCRRRSGVIDGPRGSARGGAGLPSARRRSGGRRGRTRPGSPTGSACRRRSCGRWCGGPGWR